jgi:hypothetical protein
MSWKRMVCIALTVLFWGAAVYHYATYMEQLYAVNMADVQEQFQFMPSFEPIFYACFEAMAGAVTFTFSVPKKYWTYRGRPMKYMHGRRR